MRIKVRSFMAPFIAAAMIAQTLCSVPVSAEEVESAVETEAEPQQTETEEKPVRTAATIEAERATRRARQREARPKVFTDEDLKKNTEKAKSYNAIIYGNEDWDDVGPAVDDKYGGLSVKDYNALVRMVYAEAGGEGEEGMLLVANVILNRMKSYKYPVTVSEVVSQAGQFQPYANGRYASVEPDATAVRAVRRALDGENNAPGVLYFKSVRSTAVWANKTVAFRYKNHIFYY